VLNNVKSVTLDVIVVKRTQYQAYAAVQILIIYIIWDDALCMFVVLNVDLKMWIKIVICVCYLAGLLSASLQLFDQKLSDIFNLSIF